MVNLEALRTPLTPRFGHAVDDTLDEANGDRADAADEIERLREKLATVNYIARKASLTDEEKLTDIRNMTSVKCEGKD